MKQRMREQFITTKDAVSLVIATAFAGKGKRPKPPKLWYLEDKDAVKPKGATGAELEAAVDRVGRRFPGRVH